MMNRKIIIIMIMRMVTEKKIGEDGGRTGIVASCLHFSFELRGEGGRWADHISLYVGFELRALADNVSIVMHYWL